MNKQLYEKRNNEYSPFFPIIKLEDIIDNISDKSIKWILNNYNHIYVEYNESPAITRNQVPVILRRNGLWISYNNGKDIVTEWYSGDNKDINVFDNWVSDSNWCKFEPLADGKVTYQHLSHALKQLLGKNNTITNFPDEEDLTTKDGITLSFKDREYNEKNFSGMGRVILRKNIVVIDGVYKNLLIQDMINKHNTIYEIRYDFDLNGEEITIPEGCVLDFQGGRLSNGSIVGNNTTIEANPIKIFDIDITLLGKWDIIEIYAEWFGAIKGSSNIDSSPAIQSALNFAYNTNVKKIQLLDGVYYVKRTLNVYSYTHLAGKSLPDYVYGTMLSFERNIDCVNLDAKETNSCTNVYISNICIRSGSGATGSAIIFNSKKSGEGITNLQLENVDCKYGYCGLKVNLKGYAAFTLCEFTNCSFEHCSYKGIEIISDIEGNEQGAWINHNIYNNCSFRHNGVGGFDLCCDNQIYNNIWNSCQFEGNGGEYNLETYNKEGTFGLYVRSKNKTPGSSNNVATNCYFEMNLPRRRNNKDFVEDKEFFDGTYIHPNNWLTSEDAAIKVRQVYFTVENCVSIRTHAFMTVYDNCNVNITNLQTPGYAINSSEKFKILVQCNTKYVPSNICVSGIGRSSLPIVPFCGINCTAQQLFGNNNIIEFYNCYDWSDFCIKKNKLEKGHIYLDSTWNNIVAPTQTNIVCPTFHVAPTIGNISWRTIPTTTLRSKTSLDSVVVHINDNNIKGMYPQSDSFDASEEFANVIIEGGGHSITIASGGDEEITIGSRNVTINNLTINHNYIYRSILNLLRDANVTFNKCVINNLKGDIMALYKLNAKCKHIHTNLINCNIVSPYLRGESSNSVTEKPYITTFYIYNTDLSDVYCYFSESVKFGTSKDRPKGLGTAGGFQYFDTSLNKSILWTGEKWVDANGHTADIKFSGLFDEKPDLPSIGFKYFCTDRQTTEGAADGIMIYHKGENVWVDALGRVVE